MFAGQRTEQVLAAHSEWWVKRQNWHADSSKSNKDAIPVKTRECLFPASICQRWSRKEDGDADHFSEYVSLQARIQLDWEAKTCKGAERNERERTGSFWLFSPSLPPAFCLPHCLVSSESQFQSLITLVTQEEPEIWGKRGYSQRPWLLHCESWLITNSCMDRRRQQAQTAGSI